MLFILYSEIDAASIGTNLGMPEYSYYFVLKGFQQALRTLGDIIIVQNPAAEVDAIFHEKQSQGISCVFLSFSPPNKTLTSLNCPTISVFAWEFSNLPYEVWDDEPRNDWRSVLAQIDGAITLSTHTAEVVKAVMGEGYPVCAIPVPVYGEIHGHTAVVGPRDPVLQSRKLSVSCTVIDSKFYEITDETFNANIPPACFRSFAWEGERVELGFKRGDEGSGLLGGFYESESWGTWSKIAAPWVLLPFALRGNITLGIEFSAYGRNVDRVARLRVGNQCFPLPMSSQLAHHEFVLDLDDPVNLIRFEGIDASGLSDAPDPRSMGIGLRHLYIEGSGLEPFASAKFSDIHLTLDGVVYTSVFNPGDDRKNWFEMLTGFCFAFREEPRATLLLKVTHRSVAAFLSKFHQILECVGPLKCRILILHGYFDDSAYRELFEITNYYVNTSNGEGLCLPLMEFMSAGLPAVAPNHTAMSDYVNSENTFIVESTLEPFVWRHDSRDLIRTMRYRLNWESLVDAYRASFRTAIESPERYRRMSENAMSIQRRFCSFQSVYDRIQSFLSTTGFDVGMSDQLVTAEPKAL